jgi:cell division protein FtsI (penicillin-binding protein 3)
VTSPASNLFGQKADPALLHGRRRLRLLTVGFGIAFASLGLRLVEMMPAPQAIAVAVAGTESKEPVRRRPEIVDRNGLLLAADLRIPSVYADPSLLPDQKAAARSLAEVLGVDAVELAARFANARRFAWVKHEITPTEQAAVLELGIPGVGFRTAEHRVYPKGRAAAHVLGFVDIDNRGLAGIEHGLDHGKVAALPGEREVRLSLDLRVQGVVEQELGKAVDRFKAIGGCAIVLDRHTGEVISLVSLPDFDPNRVPVGDDEKLQNRCTNGSYELGSIFKIMAHAMALETGKVSLRDSFDARSPLVIGRFRIRDDHAKNRVLTVPEIFMHSSNIGTARMAFAAGGAEPLREFLQQAGFYERMPLEIPEVAAPQVPSRWAEVTTATVSFGHGIAVTPLQFVSSLAALAGDGTHRPPTLLERDPGNLPEPTRIVSEDTADDIRSLMWLTVAAGSGTRGKVDGYLVGGKTGTAEKAIPGGRGYLRNSVLASFAAVFPIEDPRYVVLALLDEPKGDKGTYGFRYGGWTVAPAVSGIIGRIGPLLGVPASAPDAEIELRNRVMPAQVLTADGGRGASLATQRTTR